MKVTIYDQSAKLPPLSGDNFFHSRELMEICERTPRQQVYMAVITADDGTVTAHLLAIARRRRFWIAPFLYTHVRIYGDNGSSPSQFALMVRTLTDLLESKTLYLEVSHLSQKMFAYRELRSLGYFPVRWMNVHNSLHSRTPMERITDKQMRRIEAARRRGAVVKTVETVGELNACCRLLHRHNMFKAQRHVPADEFFRGLVERGHCQIFMTEYFGKVIGCAVCVYSGGDAYVFYSAALRKSYAPLHPNAVTLWAAITNAHAIGMQHIRFMDVGMPFRRTPFRDFILRFGGKETSSYRWFRISVGWLNALASWLWRE